MFYVFQNGRIVYDANILTDKDKGRYIEVEQLPEISKVEGKVGIITGYDLEKKEVKIEYFDYPEEPPIPEYSESKPPTQPKREPTEAELIQAEILLAQQAIVAKQKEQDDVLALLLLNQQKG